MEIKRMEEEEGVRARSFRYEDYNNRRAFLRSYPLHCEAEEEEEKVMVNVSNGGKRGVKDFFLSVYEWGGQKVLLLRKVKHKVAFYMVSCQPLGFKATPSLISV